MDTSSNPLPADYPNSVLNDDEKCESATYSLGQRAPVVEAVKHADQQYLQKLQQFRQNHLKWLQKTFQHEKAAELYEQDGELVTAVNLYLKAGLATRSANVVTNNPILLKNDEIVKEVVCSLETLHQYSSIAEIYQARSQLELLFKSFVNRDAFDGAVELAQQYFPSRLKDLEFLWADRLAACGKFAEAVPHYTAAGKPYHALSSALRSLKWVQAADIVVSLGEKDSGRCQKLATYLSHLDSDSPVKYEHHPFTGEIIDDIVEIFLGAREWDLAFKTVSSFLEPEKVRGIFEKKAEILGEKGNFDDAEELYVVCGCAENAISMRQSLRHYGHLIRLLNQHRPEDIQSLHLMIARELLPLGRRSSCEHHFVAGGDWKAAVEMYKEADQWEEAYRVVRTNGSGKETRDFIAEWNSFLLENVVYSRPAGPNVKNHSNLQRSGSARDVAADTDDFISEVGDDEDDVAVYTKVVGTDAPAVDSSSTSTKYDDTAGLVEKDPLELCYSPEASENHDYIADTDCDEVEASVSSRAGPLVLPNSSSAANSGLGELASDSAPEGTVARFFPHGFSKLTKEPRRNGAKKPRDGPPHTCRLCQKTFMTKAGYDSHLRVHSAEPVLSCEKCGKVVNSRQSLLYHIRVAHNVADYQCRFCLKTFGLKKQLVAHEARHSHDVNAGQSRQEPSGNQTTSRLRPRKITTNLTESGRSNRVFSPAADVLEVSEEENASESPTTPSDKGNTDNTALDGTSKPHRNLNRVKSSSSKKEKRSKYMCDHCGKAFLSQRGLKDHVNYGHLGMERKTLTCPICSETFKRDYSLRNHLKFVHRGLERRVFECPVCHHKTSTRSSLILHMRTHTGEKPYVCDVCGRRFTGRSALTAHKEKHASSADGEKALNRQYVCDQCGKSYLGRNALRKHVNYVHLGVQRKKESFPCQLCSKSFTRGKALRDHMEAAHEGKTFACPICAKTLTNKRNLRHHVEVVHSTRTFDCPACPYKTAIKARLRLHMRTHTGEKPYVCDECGKRFSAPNSLKLHKATHAKPQTNESTPRTGEDVKEPIGAKSQSDVRPFLCGICGQAFKRNQDCQRHEKRHGGEDRVKYVCDQCGKVYLHIDSFKNHVKYVHQGVERKTFHCDLCSTSFKWKADLKMHTAKMHPNVEGSEPSLVNRFECPVCQHKTSKKSNLVIHMRRHTGEKPYACKFCGKTFSQRTPWRMHEQTHAKDQTSKNPVSASDLAPKMVPSMTAEQVPSQLRQEAVAGTAMSECGCFTD